MQLKLSQAYLALYPEQVLDVNLLFVSFRLNLDEELLNWKQRVNALLEEAALVLQNLLAYILKVRFHVLSLFSGFQLYQSEASMVLYDSDNDMLKDLQYLLIVHKPQLTESTPVVLDAGIEVVDGVFGIVFIVRVRAV